MIKFRGFSVSQKKWFYGLLTARKRLPTSADPKRGHNDFYFIDDGLGNTEHVYEKSVGIEWIDGIYSGDIFVAEDKYPFFSEGKNNYIGVMEYVPGHGYAGWYYGLKCINPNLRGSACGSSAADLKGLSLKVIGNTFEHELGDFER